LSRQSYNKPFMRVVLFTGLAACVYSLLTIPYSKLDLRFLFIAVVTVSLGSRIGIEFSRLKVQITVSDTFIFLSMLLYGGEVAIMLAAVEAFFSSFRFSKLWFTRFFNGGLLSSSTFLTAFIVGRLFGSLPELLHSPVSSTFISAVGVMAFVQYIGNSGIAALRESLKIDRPFWQTWKEYYLWTSVTYLAGGTAAGLTAWLIARTGFYAFLITFPVMWIIYFTYQTYRKQLEATAAQAEQAKLHADEQMRISRALRESEEHFRSAFDHAAAGMALVGTDGHWRSVNRSLCNLLGYEEAELLQKSFQSIVHPDDLGESLMDMYQMLEGKMVTSTRERRYLHRDGREVWATVSISTVADTDGKPMHFIVQSHDITERKRAEEQLHHAAFYDSLTGLPNRALFTDHLQLAIARSKQHSEHLFGVLFLDVDRFKNINDSLGHVLGDHLLRDVAVRLEKCIRPEDTVSRFGGDEFAILLNGLVHSTDALAIAERIRREMQAKFNLNGHDVFTSVSVGIALSSVSYENAEEILRDADTAMYRAKAQGQGNYEVFDKLMHAHAISQLQLETDLRRAVERDEFEVVYQPIVTLETGKITGFEALVRWHHPTRGLVHPTEFIPLAEETELIIPLGTWVLREACRQLRHWQTEFSSETPLTMSVNLSGKQFRQADLVDRVKQILNETKVSPHCLRLEITESVVMENAEVATAMLRQLRSINVQLSIDDFGTGYSSLSYLHRFPINILKIDRSFVSRMCQEEESLGIIETIAFLASKLKLQVIAEGLETLEQKERLRELGCEFAQGFYFSKPVSIASATELLRDEYARENTAPVPHDDYLNNVEILGGVFSM
jgi:diguanylate cyclase (GGDEF)-like protein/PAS domain S-box-containing protein